MLTTKQKDTILWAWLAGFSDKELLDYMDRVFGNTYSPYQAWICINYYDKLASKIQYMKGTRL